MSVEELITDIAFDSVSINGQVIARPASISRSEWTYFWESAQQTKDDAFAEGLAQGQADKVTQ
jgi:hypothetical protein